MRDENDAIEGLAILLQRGIIVERLAGGSYRVRLPNGREQTPDEESWAQDQALAEGERGLTW